jgi:hypothetical protein
MKNAPKSDILKNLGSDIFFLTGDKVKGAASAQDTLLVTTRIFPSAENPLGLTLELSEKLRFSEPCPLSRSDGFRAANPSLR